MADKHELGSPVSVGEYIAREASKKHLWLALAITDAAILLWDGFLLGVYGASASSIIGAVVAAVVLALSVNGYGTARERILFGKIILRDGIAIKMDDEGNVVAETKVENIVDRKDE